MRVALTIIVNLLAATSSSSAFAPCLLAKSRGISEFHLSAGDDEKGLDSQQVETFSRRLLETRLSYETKDRMSKTTQPKIAKVDDGTKGDLKAKIAKERNQRALLATHLQMEERQRARKFEVNNPTEVGADEIGVVSHQEEQVAPEHGASDTEDQAISTLTDLGMVHEKPDPDFDPSKGPETMVDIPPESEDDETSECDVDKTPPAASCEVFKKTYVIAKPEDLLNFVVEDERLSVVKVFARWCKTCAAFDLRFRKLNSKEGDKFDVNGNLVEAGRVRFAEMDYNLNEELCGLLGATKLPYIIMYKGTSGKVAEFQCGPSSFQRVIDNVNEFADPSLKKT